MTEGFPKTNVHRKTEGIGDTASRVKFSCQRRLCQLDARIDFSHLSITRILQLHFCSSSPDKVGERGMRARGFLV